MRHMGAPMWLVAHSFVFSPPPEASSVMSRKKSSKSFVAFGLRLVLISWKTKNKQKTTTSTEFVWYWLPGKPKLGKKISN